LISSGRKVALAAPRFSCGVGVGVGVGVTAGVGDGVVDLSGVSNGCGVGDGCFFRRGEDVGDGVGDFSGVAVGVGDDFFRGVGVGVLFFVVLDEDFFLCGFGVGVGVAKIFLSALPSACSAAGTGAANESDKSEIVMSVRNRIALG
jgi:hypothetical protein